MLTRDMQKLTAMFPSGTCFFVHTPIPVEKLLGLTNLKNAAYLLGPIPSVTPPDRTLKFSNSSQSWHVYLIRM
jgi:hypothetical protein